MRSPLFPIRNPSRLRAGLLRWVSLIAVDGLGNVELAMLSGGAVTESHRAWLTEVWSAPIPVSDPASAPVYQSGETDDGDDPYSGGRAV